MNYQKIEELFVDFILEIIGPTEEKENKRKGIILLIKSIIVNMLNTKLPDYEIYLIPYGSFPCKTYLKDANIDITIFLNQNLQKKY